MGYDIMVRSIIKTKKVRADKYITNSEEQHLPKGNKEVKRKLHTAISTKWRSTYVIACETSDHYSSHDTDQTQIRQRTTPVNVSFPKSIFLRKSAHQLSDNVMINSHRRLTFKTLTDRPFFSVFKEVNQSQANQTELFQCENRHP